jgi:hypothetical protein
MVELTKLALEDREMHKFDTNTHGEVIVRTSATGSFTFNGLSIGGKITETTVNSTTWTPIVASPLASCNQINIQNESGKLVKLNYTNSTPFSGLYLKSGMERQYSIAGTITIYAKCDSGTAVIIVEEIA